MFDQLTKFAYAPARAFMAIIFILSGVGKIGALAFRNYSLDFCPALTVCFWH